MENPRELILKSFLVESEEGLAQMEQSVLELESSPDDLELVQVIFRVVHTMKGNAAILELPYLLSFSHGVEDLLDAIRKNSVPVTTEITTVLLTSLDILREMAAAAGHGKEEKNQAADDVLADISRHLNGGKNAQKTEKTETKEQRSSSASADDLSARVQAGSSVGEEAFLQTAVHREARRTLRVDLDRVDNMLNLTSEIVIAQGRMRNVLERFRNSQGHEVLDLHRDLERLFKDLQREIMCVRMVPIGPMFRQLKRSVRDMSSALNKLARLEITKDDVDVDTTVLEHLKDPLLHMVRNAIDHGIEAPEVRERLGKDRCGLLKLSAAHANGNIVVKLQDDGAGFDRNSILEKGRRMGLLSESGEVSDQEIFAVVFRAGFSTTEAITDMSGRGVGLDIVKKNIESLRGSVDVQSEEGKGATITIRLPLTLAIIDGFSVTAGGESFIIPSDYVTECTELVPELRGSGASGVLNLRGNPLPFVRLREAFNISGQAPERENVVVVKVDEFDAGIAVDRLLGSTEAVIKPLGKALRAVAGIAGSTILENGRVGLIVDVPGLLRGVTPAAFRSKLA